MTQQLERRGDFAETAVGTAVLVAIQFLSLPLLVGGLALIGLVKLGVRWRSVVP